MDRLKAVLSFFNIPFINSFVAGTFIRFVFRVEATFTLMDLGCATPFFSFKADL